MSADLDAQRMTQAADLLWSWAALFLPRLVAAVAIPVGGVALIGWIDRTLRSGLTHMHSVDSTLRPILVALVRYALLILVVIGALSQLGFQMTSLLAVLGAAGLAIGLARISHALGVRYPG